MRPLRVKAVDLIDCLVQLASCSGVEVDGRRLTVVHGRERAPAVHVQNANDDNLGACISYQLGWQESGAPTLEWKLQPRAVAPRAFVKTLEHRGVSDLPPARRVRTALEH